MAPIDPRQLLVAFAPLLTRTGGIRNVDEVPKLSSLMKKFSRKLVSRCVYCNVLMATNQEVLQVFLTNGGWETINSWMKMAKDSNNNCFLQELLKLLIVLPMTVERLKENDTAKVVRSLVKSDNKEIAELAYNVKESWMKLVTGAVPAKDKDATKAKKRKKEKEETDTKLRPSKSVSPVEIDLATLEQETPPEAKKMKTKESDNNSSLIQVDENSQEKSSPETATKENERTPRPVTAKVKFGKSRLEGLVASTQNVSSKKDKANKQPTPKLSIKPAELNTPVIKPKLNDPKTTPILTKPHILQDSTGFMESLISTPNQSQPKKKAKTRTSTSGDESPTKVTPKIPFYKDTFEEKICEDEDSATQESNCDEAQIVDNDVLEEVHNDLELPDINISESEPPPVEPIINPVVRQIKPILTLTKRKDKVKRNIRWSEDKLEEIKFFELDETERVNVTRPAGSGFADMKRFDMKYEGQMFRQRGAALETMDDSKVEDRAPWRLVQIDLPDDFVIIEQGKDSVEKHIQAERTKTVLEAFYGSEQVPDAPFEPDFEVVAAETTKIIPLEDENNPNNTHDYSNIDLPPPRTGEVLPNRGQDFTGNANFRHSNSVPHYQQANNPVPVPAQFGMSNGQRYLTNHITNAVDPFGRPQQPSSNFLQPTINQQWIGDPPGHFMAPQIPSPQFMQPMRLPNQRPTRPPYVGRKQVCRHFLKSGVCKYQKCSFAHVRDDKEMIR